MKVKEKEFLLFSMKILGVQELLHAYTGRSSLNILKDLISYLETILEQNIECILLRMHLSGEKLIYKSGDRCYILLPNNEEVVEEVVMYMEEFNIQLRELFDISLYAAYGYAPCGSAMAKKLPEVSYSELLHQFDQIEEMISEQELHRYTAADILALNNTDSTEYSWKDVIRPETDNTMLKDIERIGVLEWKVAALYRQNYLFFKRYLDELMESRSAVLCYSCSEYVYIVGACKDVVDIAIDLSRYFSKCTHGTLTICGDFTICNDSYPASVFRMDVYKLEEIVSGEKYNTISAFFRQYEKRDLSLLSNLMRLIQAKDEKINFARYVYLLTRLEAERAASQEEKLRYSEFSVRMYEWIREPKERSELKTAIAIYVYLNQKKGMEYHADKSSELCG